MSGTIDFPLCDPAPPPWAEQRVDDVAVSVDECQQLLSWDGNTSSFCLFFFFLSSSQALQVDCWINSLTVETKHLIKIFPIKTSRLSCLVQVCVSPHLNHVCSRGNRQPPDNGRHGAGTHIWCAAKVTSCNGYVVSVPTMPITAARLSYHAIPRRRTMNESLLNRVDRSSTAPTRHGRRRQHAWRRSRRLLPRPILLHHTLPDSDWLLHHLMPVLGYCYLCVMANNDGEGIDCF